MKKLIVTLVMLVFICSLMPVELAAQESAENARIKEKIREHQMAIKRLRGELHTSVSSPEADIAGDQTVMAPPPPREAMVEERRHLREERPPAGKPRKPRPEVRGERPPKPGAERKKFGKKPGQGKPDRGAAAKRSTQSRRSVRKSGRGKK